MLLFMLIICLKKKKRIIVKVEVEPRVVVEESISREAL